MSEPMDTIEMLFPMNILKIIVEKFSQNPRSHLQTVSRSFYEAVCLFEESTCIMNINDKNVSY